MEQLKERIAELTSELPKELAEVETKIAEARTKLTHALGVAERALESGREDRLEEAVELLEAVKK